MWRLVALYERDDSPDLAADVYDDSEWQAETAGALEGEVFG